MEILIKKAMKGDAEAFIQLMDRHELVMYKTAKAILLNEEDIGDAIQETILAAYQNIKTLKQVRYFKTWLTRILINKCNDLIRKNRPVVLVEQYQDVSYEDNTAERLGFRDCFDTLTKEYKLVLTLYYVQGFNTREISEVLNESENTIKSRLSRGRKYLKKVLLESEKGVDEL